MSASDELVSQFMAFTGSVDAEKANSYLEMSGNDLQTAVSLYMDNEQGGGGGTAAAATGGAASGGGGLGGPDDVRAPDATQTMRLMEDVMMPDPAYHLMNAIMEEQFAQTAFAAPVDARAAVNAAAAVAAAASVSSSRGNMGTNAANKGDGDNDDNHDDVNMEAKEMDDEDDYEYDDGDVPSSDRQPNGSSRLSDIFAPPTHLIQKTGGFQGVRTMAKDSKRWLLVNIQRDSEFASHALNRDVWRDELVENLIREGFIFWQQMDVTSEGRTYIERYQVHEFPHVAIIDPRTGRLMWRKEGWTQERPLTAEIFAETAMDFCSRNSFDRPPQAPRPGAAAVRPPNNKRPMNAMMSEDEQLAAAMQASIDDVVTSNTATNAKSNKDDDDDDEVQFLGTQENNSNKLKTDTSDMINGDATKPPAVQDKDAEEPPLTMIEELLSVVVSDEPGSGGARIQFRMPDGKRVVRRFPLADTVKTIYAFIAQSNETAKEGKEFLLMAGFPPVDLIGDIDKTIDECNLSGQAITVRWK